MRCVAPRTRVPRGELGHSPFRRPGARRGPCASLLNSSKTGWMRVYAPISHTERLHVRVSCWRDLRVWYDDSEKNDHAISHQAREERARARAREGECGHQR